MDPNAALADFRTAYASGNATEAADAMAGLDEWLSEGGFLPDAWKHERTEDTPQHTSPHSPGNGVGCPACLASCHCQPKRTECVYRGEHTGVAWSEPQLRAALESVQNPENWKYAIDATVPADADQELIAEAVSYYTGSCAEIFPEGNHLRVQAAGYYACIGS